MVGMGLLVCWTWTLDLDYFFGKCGRGGNGCNTEVGGSINIGDG